MYNDIIKKKKNSLPLHCYTYFSKSNAIFIHEIDKLNIEENRNRRANSTTYTCLKAILEKETLKQYINLPEFLLGAFVSSLEWFPEAVVLQVSDL